MELLDASGCPGIAYLDCSHNSLTTAALSSAARQVHLECCSNETAFTILGSAEISNLRCDEATFSKMCAATRYGVERLDLHSRGFHGGPAAEVILLDMVGTSSLRELCFAGDGWGALRELDLIPCASLLRIHFFTSYLQRLDVSGCPTSCHVDVPFGLGITSLITDDGAQKKTFTIEEMAQIGSAVMHN